MPLQFLGWNFKDNKTIVYMVVVFVALIGITLANVAKL